MNKIVYTTIAIHPLYRTISFKLIKSFLEYAPDSELVIFTDNVEFYGNYTDVPHVHIRHIALDRKRLPDFDLNVKSIILQKVYEQFQPQYIVLSDCDMFFASAVDTKWFDTIESGMSMAFGNPPVKIPATDFQNSLIREKGIALGGLEHTYYTFREGCLIFNTSQVDNFLRFAQEWKKMYHEVAERGLTDCCQIFELNLACERAGLPMNNMKGHPLQDVLFYEERNGAIGAALR